MKISSKLSSKSPIKQSSTSSRLKEVMRIKRLRQIDILNAAKPFCLQYGVKLEKNDLSQYVNGKVEPKQEKLTILSLALGVSILWLTGYDVPMDEAAYQATLDDNPYELYMLDAFNKLDLDNQIYVSKWVVNYLENKGESSPAETHLLNAFSELNDTGQNQAIFQVEMLTKVDEYKKAPTEHPKVSRELSPTEKPTPHSVEAIRQKYIEHGYIVPDAYNERNPHLKVAENIILADATNPKTE